jgi:hypothetical protein
VGDRHFHGRSLGPALLQPSSFTLIQNEILLLKAVGVTAISVEVSFPMLDADFFNSIGQPGYQSQFTAFYANVAAAIRAQGLQVIVESQSMIPTGLQSTWGTGLQSFYNSLTTFDAYENARARTAALVARTMRPDSFVLQEEPDTESAQASQTSAGTVSGSTDMLSRGISAVRQANVAGMKIGAGFGSRGCRRIRCSPTASRVATAKAAGLPITISQTWLRKVRDTEWEQINGDIQEAREAYDFWEPLDLAFLYTVAALANYSRMPFVRSHRFRHHRPLGAGERRGGAKRLGGVVVAPPYCRAASFGASFNPRSMSSGSTCGSRPRKARYISAGSCMPPRERIISRNFCPFARVMPPCSRNQ